MARGERAASERRFDDARRAFEGAVALGELAFGPESLEVARALGDLGSAIARARIDAHAHTLTTPESFDIAKRTLDIYERAYGTNDRRLHHPVEHYGAALEGMGRLDEALATYERAAALAEPLEDGDSLLLLRLSMALARGGRISDALDVVDRIEAFPGFGAMSAPSALVIVEQSSPIACANAVRVLASVDRMLEATTSADERLPLLESRARTLVRLGRRTEGERAAEEVYAARVARGAMHEHMALRAWMKAALG